MKSKRLLAIIIGALLLAGCGKTVPADTPQQLEEQSPSAATPESSPAAPTGEEIDYTQYLKKTWVKKNDADNNSGNAVSFSISEIKNGKISAELLVTGPAPAYPNAIARFDGIISNHTAECQFTDSRGNKGTIKLSFEARDEMKAAINLTDKSEDTKAQPPVGTFRFAPYNLKDIEGFSPIEEQSFMVDLNSWGKVKFVAGKLTEGSHIPVVFYLTNQNGDILYNFYPTLPYRVDVKAVSFEDVSKDGLKDIIIIVDDDYSGQGSAPIATVYFQKDDGTFANDLKLDQEINDSKSNKDVKAVKSYLSRKF
ncbi:hypothetical protein [Desulfosporosinus youngiae]|uniref:Lipoprotein n=1 Tax=Desulfosporosinus youngiae DSM 17734 TaxID=768710 RepID=H5Y4K4_9FIRM|nr:hypothetical protein [Desulfosporosinus youngiae]EHQ89602.1 hypothetical protein DesyoDRAFT_2536 [Desulfosporosinus youngiae DSM 17734]